jgi:hypothetical protein
MGFTLPTEVRPEPHGSIPAGSFNSFNVSFLSGILSSVRSRLRPRPGVCIQPSCIPPALDIEITIKRSLSMQPTQSLLRLITRSPPLPAALLLSGCFGSLRSSDAARNHFSRRAGGPGLSGLSLWNCRTSSAAILKSLARYHVSSGSQPFYWALYWEVRAFPDVRDDRTLSTSHSS